MDIAGIFDTDMWPVSDIRSSQASNIAGISKRTRSVDVILLRDWKVEVF